MIMAQTRSKSVEKLNLQTTKENDANKLNLSIDSTRRIRKKYKVRPTEKITPENVGSEKSSKRTSARCLLKKQKKICSEQKGVNNKTTKANYEQNKNKKQQFNAASSQKKSNKRKKTKYITADYNNHKSFQKERNKQSKPDQVNYFRLLQLFPHFKPIFLQRIYTECKRSFVRTVDNILHLKRYCSYLYQVEQLQSAAVPPTVVSRINNVEYELLNQTNKLRSENYTSTNNLPMYYNNSNSNMFIYNNNNNNNQNLYSNSAPIELNHAENYPSTLNLNQNCQYSDMPYNNYSYVPNGTIDGIQAQIKTNLSGSYNGFAPDALAPAFEWGENKCKTPELEAPKFTSTPTRCNRADSQSLNNTESPIIHLIL